MKKNTFILFLTVSCNFLAADVEYSICDGLLHYYLDQPNHQKSYPLLIAIEGSYVSWRGPRSVYRLHTFLSRRLSELGCGLATLERRGATRCHIDKRMFHFYNTPTQRLNDHLLWIEHLRNNPPNGWDGRIFVLGGSEGGPIAIKLARRIGADACIAISGCGDQSMKELVWQKLLTMEKTGGLHQKFVQWWCKLPKDRDTFDRLCFCIAQDPNPNRWWFGQTYRYWSDALDQTEKEDLFALRCPTLVISGTKDVEHPSTCRVFKQAVGYDNLQHVTIEGMGHDVKHPKWKVFSTIEEFILSHQSNF